MSQLRALVVALTLSSCALPKNVVRPFSAAIVTTGEDDAGALVADAVAAHPGESGFSLYNTGEKGIQARVALTDVAQSSIDAQYYMWASDAIGRVLLERIIAAADRGVRVRLLIDDFDIDGPRHSPSRRCRPTPTSRCASSTPTRAAGCASSSTSGRFNELNRRMHNKMFVADGQVAVVGGRNLTDDYFGMGKKLDFRDFDLLAVGPVVAQAEGSFDHYWNSALGLSDQLAAQAVDRRRSCWRRADASTPESPRIGPLPYQLPRDRNEALAWLEPVHRDAIWVRPRWSTTIRRPWATRRIRPPGLVWQRLVTLARQHRSTRSSPRTPI